MLRHSVPHFQLNFSGHCVLSGGTQRRALVPERNINSFIRMGIEPTPDALQSHPCEFERMRQTCNFDIFLVIG